MSSANRAAGRDVFVYRGGVADGEAERWVIRLALTTASYSHMWIKTRL